MEAIQDVKANRHTLRNSGVTIQKQAYSRQFSMKSPIVRVMMVLRWLLVQFTELCNVQRISIDR
jgi:hypothetical protein